MEKMRYIQFKSESSLLQEKKNIIGRILSLILPKANPDFDDLYDAVTLWILEFENPEYANREIGLDKNGKVIVKGPWKKNLGFWLDTNMRLRDFERFKPEVVDSSIFNKRWKENI